MIIKAASLLLVAALWGVTNPLIKRNSKDIVKIREKNPLKKFFLEIKYLCTNIQYLLPMLVNQIGSIVFFFTLQSTELSLSVPIANSLTFVFTAISGWFLGEKIPNKSTILGCFLIVVGSFLCFLDKYLQ